MTAERWRQIERLYHAALERSTEDRAAFLTEACGNDAALRRELDSLLEYQNRAGAFIETPAGAGRLASTVRRLEASSIPGRFIGRVFGSYELKALIAAGGMGEVYRAIDPRLNRTVAIKTLPEHMSNDPQRIERFKREARIVSSLNHPHICALHDIGIQDDIHYLVMEHIDGETLEKRLERGPLPVARAIEYSIQIVDALARAHRLGVIHRDLKPGNIMLTKSGVKVLDFGLAARYTPAAGIAADEGNHDGSKALTVEGTIQGTLQYISPEQLEGRTADARTDLFAFGAVAYEMITGIRAFRAESQAGLISAILKDDPRPIVDVAPGVPVALAQTLSRCLAKDPDERWQTVNDLLFQLRSIAASPAAIENEQSQWSRLPRRAERVVWTAIVVASVIGTWFWARARDVRPPAPVHGTAAVRYALLPAEGLAFSSGYDLPFALSPDGRHIVYVGAKTDATKQLWLHSLYSALGQPITGTEGASSPFWSPDSQWIGFFAGNSLKKVRVSSGLVQIVAMNVTTYGGASWNTDDVIVFPRTRPGGLSRVSARGGPVTPATTATEGSHFWPQFLGDGEHFVYVAPNPGRLYIGSLRNAPPRELMKFPVRISSVAYVPGYLLFVLDSTLFARPFDETRLEFSGEPVRVVDGIPVIGFGRAPFSVSASGLLAYWSYAVGTPSVLEWFDRDGRASAAVDTPAQYIGFAISPDGRQLALSRTGKDGGADLWLRDLARGTETQLTFDGAAFTPQWSPDGTRLAFSGPGEKPPPKLFVKNIGSQRPALPLIVPSTTVPDFASGWSGDGRSVVSVRVDPASGDDLWVQYPERGVGEPLPFNTRFNESLGKVSPDNHWIAYVTDESGRDEVWVASFPAGKIRRQVSIGGGTSPQWGDGSREIVYVAPDQRLMAAAFERSEAGGTFGTPRALFQIENLAAEDRSLFFATRNEYVAVSNGKRFLAAIRTRDPNAPPITVVVNWLALLNR
jgi:serine/threonine protein kinase/Tol biopolymer transport system component